MKMKVCIVGTKKLDKEAQMIFHKSPKFSESGNIQF
jgi:hypothetical protein